MFIYILYFSLYIQSAYKAMHSVETALLVVFDDLLMAVDRRKHILVTLLDYSAAFDTIEHSILFHMGCQEMLYNGCHHILQIGSK